MLTDHNLFPLKLILDDENEYQLNMMELEGGEFQSIKEKVKGSDQLNLIFYSSQPEFVFKMIHELADVIIKDISGKIDPILREFIKNAEKENAANLAHKYRVVEPGEEVSLAEMGKIMNAKTLNPETGEPLLCSDPEYVIQVKMKIVNNELIFEIYNAGNIEESLTETIQRRIDLGVQIAQFDLVQEFERKTFPDLKEKLLNMFYQIYDPSDFERLWMKALDMSFDDYWMMSPYFMIISTGVHSSIFPFFASAHSALNITLQKEKNPGQEHFSAGLGFLQCAFIIESNRSEYGTYGQVIAPVKCGGQTMVSFKLGLSKIDIRI